MSTTAKKTPNPEALTTGEHLIRASDRLFEEVCALHDGDEPTEEHMRGLIEIGLLLWRARWQLGVLNDSVGYIEPEPPKLEPAS